MEPASSAVVSRRTTVLRLVVPPLLAVTLFAAAIALVVIPATEAALMERKRETLRAIVGSALSLLERHAAREREGLPRIEAQAQAAAELRGLRYGEANKDYLWVMDATPRMIAHPYRSDLEGQPLGGFTDAHGKRLFMACVEAVRADGAGYVDYMWQWQDDARRIVPKLSYVHRFEPWGWIVGSGIYLEDVRDEIGAVTGRLAWISAGIVAVVALLLAFTLRQGFVSESRRRAAEDELARSRARYQALAHAGEDAVLLLAGGRIACANRAACQLLGRDEPALTGLPAGELLAAGVDTAVIGGLDDVPRECRLAAAGGPIPVLMSASPVLVHGQPGQVVIIRDLRPDAPATDDARRRLAAEAVAIATTLDQASILAPAAGLAQPATVLPLTAAAAETDAALRRDGAVVLAAPDGGVAGIVTAHDRLLRGGGTAYAAMSAPVLRLPAGASIATAMDLMASARVGRLLVEGPDAPPALLTARQVLTALHPGPAHLIAQVAIAGEDGLAALHQQAVAWQRCLAALQVAPEAVAAEGTRIADAVLARCIALAVEECGPPPAACAFLAVGSQGRGEMLPGGDQDNALVHADGADSGWFLRFAQTVNERFQRAGWPRCGGGCIAGDARWCLPLSAWRERFAGWIAHAEPKALMEVDVFFDFRSVWGEAALADDLRAAVLAAVAARPVFCLQLAQDTLAFRPPLGLFGGIRPDDGRLGTINLKGAMLHYTAFARVGALAHGIPVTGTVPRLRALAAAGQLPQDTLDETLAGWRFLLGLRLAARTREEGAAGDHLDPAALPAWDHALLKRALAQIGVLQQRLRAYCERAG